MALMRDDCSSMLLFLMISGCPYPGGGPPVTNPAAASVTPVVTFGRKGKSTLRTGDGGPEYTA